MNSFSSLIDAENLMVLYDANMPKYISLLYWKRKYFDILTFDDKQIFY